ncbi:MAG: hypothetical protein ACR2QV_10450 [Gammaproteobacteria bacterium]
MREVRYISFGGGKPPNPLVQILGFVAAICITVVAVIVGGIVLAGLLGFVLLAAIFIYARVWWVTRKFRAAERQRDPPGSSETVEAEYRVIDISEPDGDGPRGNND